MKKLLTIALFFFVSDLSAQNHLPNIFFNEIETIPCPFDPSTSVKVYQDWLIYQTLDNTWNGPIDSTRCMGLASDIFEGISLQDADLERPIFVRSKITDDNKYLLQKNDLHTAVAYVSQFTNEVEMIGGIDCEEGICSGLMVGIEIPDSVGMGSFMRWHTDVPDQSSIDGSFSTCVPSEYFDENYLREFIIKMTLAPGTTADQNLPLGHAYFGSVLFPNHISEIIPPENTFADTSYEVPLYAIADLASGWPSFDYLLLYKDLSAWPSSANPSYVEGRPAINTPDPKTININVYSSELFVPQPFAFIRGAFVEGSDIIRHQVNLVNHDGDICMGGPIDFVFDDDTKYIHYGGHVNFDHRSACMMFKNNSALEVGDNSFFHFGQAGKGILALRPGSTIRLGKGSSLLIDNLLWLQGITTPKHTEPQIYMELNPGSILTFGEHANIINTLSEDANTQLNIYMNGGILNDGELSIEAKSHINKLYPPLKPGPAANFHLLKNPVDDLLEMVYYAAEYERIYIGLFDLNGKRMGNELFHARPGENTFQYNMNGISSGIYFLTATSPAGKVSLKVVKAP